VSQRCHDQHRLTIGASLYVTVDDFCHSHPPKSDPAPKPPSPKARSSPSPSSPGGPASPASGTSTATLRTKLLDACPTLPSRSQFNRLVRSCTQIIEAFFLHLVGLLEVRKCPYEALDSSAMPVRDAKRRGHGWLAGDADFGWSNSTGWYGTKALACSPPSTLPRGHNGLLLLGRLYRLPEHGGELLRPQSPPESEAFECGLDRLGSLRSRQGFRGRRENHLRWQQSYGAWVIHPPKRNSRKPWSKRLRR